MTSKTLKSTQLPWLGMNSIVESIKLDQSWTMNLDSNSTKTPNWCVKPQMTNSKTLLPITKLNRESNSKNYSKKAYKRSRSLKPKLTTFTSFRSSSKLLKFTKSLLTCSMTYKKSIQMKWLRLKNAIVSSFESFKAWIWRWWSRHWRATSALVYMQMLSHWHKI